MKRVAKEVDAEILRLHHVEKWKIGTIATQLHVHHNVVRRVLGLRHGKGEPGEQRQDALESFKVFIAEVLQRHPVLTATRLYDMLYERGYRGSARCVRRHVAAVRPKPPKPAFLEVNTLAGEQAQVDWAHVGRIAVAGGQRDLWLFVMVLGYSRALWGEFVIDLTVHSLLRSLVRASVAFGGCPRTWLFDNPKIVVTERVGEAIRFNSHLLDLAARMRVQPRLCAPHKPTDKGKVERSIRYLRERFLAARTIVSVDRGNELLHDFITRIAHTRPHPKLKPQSVAQVLEQERPALLRLPDPLPITDQVLTVEVDAYGFIAFDKNRYSVPGTIDRKQQLTLCADDRELRIFLGNDHIVTHTRSFGRQQTFEIQQHRVELLRERKRARATKGRDRIHVAIPDAPKLFALWLGAGLNVGLCTIQLLKLLDLYGDDLVQRAVQDVLMHGIHDVSAIAVRCDMHRRSRNAPPPLEMTLAPHVSERDVIPHPLENYDESDND